MRTEGARLEAYLAQLQVNKSQYDYPKANAVADAILAPLNRLLGKSLTETATSIANAIRDVRLDLNLLDRYSGLNQTLIGKIRNVLRQLDALESSKCRPTPLEAVFTQALYHTVYSEPIYLPGWTYDWSVSIPADPGCAEGFSGNRPIETEATWFHADRDIGGPCSHLGGDYGAAGHPGVVTLTVSNSRVVCTLRYKGTLTGEGGSPECVKKKS
jgi:hypothetical protein